MQATAPNRGGYIAEAKRVLAAAVHTASAQEAAVVESRCGHCLAATTDDSFRWNKRALLACWMLHVAGMRSPAQLLCGSSIAISPLLRCLRDNKQPHAPLNTAAHCFTLCSCSGAIGPLLRYLLDNKHDDAALRSGLHTLSLLVSNSPNRGIIVSFQVRFS